MNAVDMIGIEKTFGSVRANVGVDLDVRHGEVHALVGENGAGKTTLMKILFGLYQPDAGRILLDGEPTAIPNPHAAISHGIGMVHQHFMLIQSLTAAENVLLGIEPTRRTVFLDRERAKRTTIDLSHRFGMRIDPDAIVRDLSVGLRQRVEILKALARGARILILDEPTAVLTPQEATELFTTLKGLVGQGMTVIFISHKLSEVMRVSDRVTVMRGGAKVGTVNTNQTSPSELASMMIGRDFLPRVDKEPAQPGNVVLEVSALRATDDRGVAALRGVNLTVRAAEIVGIAGVEGNGQSELVEALIGLRAADSGLVSLGGEDVTRYSTRRRREAGISAIPEDRLRHGVAAAARISDNLAMSRHYRPPLTRGPFLSPRRIASYAWGLVRGNDVRTRDINLPASSLSGGNMQKLVVARELARAPKLLIAAQPTRGVDIGAIQAIHEHIVAERDRGAGVLLVSAELSEIMALADRIAVLYEGVVTGVFAAGTISEEELGLYMLGVKRAAEPAA
jgi:general nucleoside transport system ATP-binding protein